MMMAFTPDYAVFGHRALTIFTLLTLGACSSGSSNDTADNANTPDQQALTPAPVSVAAPTAPTPPADDGDARISPVLQIERRGRPGPPRPDPRPELEERTIDGSNNNLADATMGAHGVDLRRLADAAYSDRVSSMAGDQRPNARAISNAVAHQSSETSSLANTSDFLWQWGQFVDHDLSLTDGVDPAEPANIAVPAGDIYFDPDGGGTVFMPMNRSIYNTASIPRQQINEITSWIDASNVYGSDEERATVLRTFDGTGRLKTSDGDFLPFNEENLPNASNGINPMLFLGGDVRANEQAGLVAMHTLFVREHNRLTGIYAEQFPQWDGEQLYEKARQIVGAEMQVITYREFLPALLGPNAIGPYQGYNDGIDATIANEFAHAAYRLGHSMLSEFILRLDANGNEISFGHLPLRAAFFNPSAIIDEGGIEPVLRGLASQRHQRIDNLVVDDVRNFLFGNPGSGGFDLAALNIQRGRDHGLPGYNDMREALGLQRAELFSDVSTSADTVTRLASVYASVNDIDLWVGGLAEDTIRDSQLGELFHTIVTDQFRRLRDGDRYWYQRYLSPDEQQQVESRRLSEIIRLNTTIGSELQDNVFVTTGN